MVSYIDEVRNDAQERGEAIGKIKAFLSIGYTPTQIAQHLNESLEQILDIIDSFNK